MYAERANGKLEAKEWLTAQNKSTQAGFGVLFKRIVLHGKIVNKELFRHLDGGVWEFKKKGNRILTFQLGSAWYLTHHYSKSGQKCPPRQITRAKLIRTEFLAVLAKEKQDGQ